VETSGFFAFKRGLKASILKGFYASIILERIFLLKAPRRRLNLR